MTEISKLIEKHKAELSLSLDEAIQSALVEYEVLKNTGQSGEPSHIYISFLRSTVLCKQPFLRIDIYDKDDRSDLMECSTKWDITAISNNLYLEADSIIKKDGIKDEYKLEQLWLELSDEYSKELEVHISDIIGSTNASNELECTWHYGRFLDSATKVWGGD